MDRRIQRLRRALHPTLLLVCGFCASALVGVTACTSLHGLSEPDDTNGTLPDRQTPRGSSESTSPLDPLPGASPSPSSSGAPPKQSFCEVTKTTFCADFDGGDLMTGWSGRSNVHGSTQLSDQAFVAVTDPVAAGIVARVYLLKEFGGSLVSEIEYTFAVRIEQLGATPANGGTLAVLQLGVMPSATYELQLNVFADGVAVLAERGPARDGGVRPYAEHKLPPIVAGAWRRVAIRVKATGSFEMSMDGAVVLNETNTIVPLPKEAPSLFLGVTYVDPPAAAWTVRYDDVSADLH